jgi:predicted unusual protein kinase regulating ubiquinone biosynthesis (AarF/ABC1/UbiB family)
MMAEVQAMNKDEMVKTFFAVMKKDADQVIHTLINMGLLDAVPDMTPVRRVMQVILDEFTEKPLDIQAFSRMKTDVYAMFEQQPFRLPSQMTYILKSLTTLDGIARILDPEYNLTVAAQPFVKSLATSDKGSLLGSLARQAKDFVGYKLTQPNRTEQALQQFSARLERGELLLNVRSSESERILRRVHLGLKCLIFACLFGSTFIGGIILLTSPYQGMMIATFVLAAIFAVALTRSFLQLQIRERLDNLAGR